MTDIVAINLKNYIHTKKIKQKILAREMGISEKQLSALLCGRKKTTTSIVLKFCEVLQVTPNDLYGF